MRPETRKIVIRHLKGILSALEQEEEKEQKASGVTHKPRCGKISKRK